VTRFLNAGLNTLLGSQVAELFNVQKAAISKHAKNIFDSKGLERGATVKHY